MKKISLTLAFVCFFALRFGKDSRIWCLFCVIHRKQTNLFAETMKAEEDYDWDGLRGQFNTGENIVYDAQNSLLISSGAAIAANEELGSLKYRFDELAAEVKSMEKPVDDLNAKIETVRQAIKDLLCAEVDLNQGCMELRSQYGKTRSFLWTDDVQKDPEDSTQSMDDLIAKCNDFSKKYL